MLYEDPSKDDFAPTMKEDEKPNLRDYQDKESKKDNRNNRCSECNKEFSSTEELTTHYRRQHPEAL
jgi:C2H2-type zinc finger